MLSYEYTLIPGSEDRRYFQLRSESRELAAQILGLVRQSHGIPGATLLDGFHSDLNKLLRSLMLEAALQEDFAQAEQLALLRARFVKRVLVGGDGNYSRKDWRLCALLSDLEMLPSFGPELSDELLSIKPVLGPVFSHAHDREMRRQLERLAPPYRWKRNLRWAFHKKERAQVERGLKLGYDLPVKEKRLEYLQLYLADYEKKRPGQATSIALSKRITKLVTEKLN